MTVDKEFCMSSYMAFRYIEDDNKDFYEHTHHENFAPFPEEERVLVYSSDDIDCEIQKQMDNFKDKRKGILLSGGMDSAIVASYLKGSDAYTFRFLNGDFQKEELERAEYYANYYGLNLHYVDINWDTVIEHLTPVMKEKGAPVHSIEPQIYKTLLAAKADGCEYVLCGENADVIFGGFDGLLSKDWAYEDFIQRYNYLDPNMVLKNPVDISSVYEPYRKDNNINAHKFISRVFAEESLNSYNNVADIAGINLVMPFSNMKMGCQLDLERVRNGENKYLIRELFKKRYNGLEPNKKLPMPRAVGVWLKDLSRSDIKNEEFKDFDISALKPDQKWLVYIADRFLTLLKNGEI